MERPRAAARTARNNLTHRQRATVQVERVVDRAIIALVKGKHAARSASNRAAVQVDNPGARVAAHRPEAPRAQSTERGGIDIGQARTVAHGHRQTPA